MKVKVEYPKAMWSPESDYKVVQNTEEEKELRKDGWIDGHEYWARFNKPSVEEQSPTKKSRKEKT